MSRTDRPYWRSVLVLLPFVIAAALLAGIFSLAWALLAAPVPLLPANGDEAIIPTFSWLPSPGAAYYEVEIGPQSSPTTVYWSGKSDYLVLTPESATSLPNAPLYWRVRAFDAADAPGDWSSRVLFTKHIPAPELISPPRYAAITNPSFEWSQSEGAAYYELELAADPSFTTIAYTHKTYNLATTPTTGFPNGVYAWRVVPYDAAGHAGSPSEVVTFTKHLPAPLLSAPQDGETVTEPRLSWQRSPGAALYQVEVSLEADLDPLSQSQVTGNLSYIPAVSLAEGTFYWRVVPMDSARNRGTPSLVRTFIRKLTAPTLANPADGASRSTPTFLWNAAPGASYYRLELAKDAAFTNSRQTFDTYNTAYTPLSLISPGTYYWRVFSMDAREHPGQPSPTRSLVVLAPPTAFDTIPELLTPSDSETVSNDPTFRWTPAIGAARYTLKVSKTADFASTYASVGTAYTSYTPAVAGIDSYPTGTYYWKVEARSSTGTLISTSAVFSLTKQVAVHLDDPDEGAILFEDPQFSWVAHPGADHYTIELLRSDMGSYTSITTDATAFRTHESEVDTYPAGTYHWRVRARNTVGTTLAESELHSFTKAISETLLAPGSGAYLALDPTFRWEPLIGVDHYTVYISKTPDFSSSYDTVTTDYTQYTPATVFVDTYANSTLYWWKASARDNVGTQIAVSSPQPFTKQQPLYLFQPAEDAWMGSAPTFRWSQFAGADHYTLFVSTSPTFDSAYDTVTTDYTTYTPYRANRDTYAPGTYYWRVRARTITGVTLAESISHTFTIDTLQPTSTPLGAPTATPTITPTATIPPTFAPGQGPTPTPPGVLPTVAPPPANSRTIGSLVVYANTFTQISSDLWEASGNVRFGPSGSMYVALLQGTALLDYASSVVEGSSDSLVHLLIDGGRSTPLFAGPFNLDPSSGLADMPANALSQLATLGDLNVDEATPVQDFQFNAIQGWAKGRLRALIYPLEDVLNSAMIDFTLYHTGVIGGGLGVGDLEFEIAGVTFAVEEAVFSYVAGTGGTITISEASIALPASLDLGAEGSASDIVLSRDGLESIGGGEIKVSLPEMAVPGTSGKFSVAGASVTLALEPEGKYMLTGRADFSLPNIQSRKNPGTSYDGSLYAEFQLSQDGLHYVLMGGTIEPGLPIGQSGMALTGMEGRVTLRPEVRVQITGTIESQLEIPPLGPVVSGTPSVWVKLSQPYEVGVSGEVQVLIFDAAEASLVLSQSNGLLGSVSVNYFPYALSGTGSLHVWRSGGEFHFTGSAQVTLGFKKGALGSYAGISLPPADFTFGSVSAQVGEFCTNRYCSSPVYGFKGAVDITINAFFKKITLASYTFFLDVDGTLDYGSSLDQYRLADQPLIQAYLDAQGLPPEAGHVITFTVANTDLLLAGITWESGSPLLRLRDPEGVLVEPAPVYPGLAYTETLTSRTYFIEKPLPGTWEAVIDNLNGGENYRFESLGRNLPPELSASALTALAIEGMEAPTGYLIEWNALDSDPDTNLSLFYDSDGQGADGTLIASGIDPAQGSYLWEPVGVQSGVYSIYAEIDDLKNVPVTAYFAETVPVVNDARPAAPSGLLAEFDRSLQTCWNLNAETDVTGYVVYLGSLPGVYDLGIYEVGNVSCATLPVPPWTAQVYLAVLAYDNSGNYSTLSTPLQVKTPHMTYVYLPLQIRK